jgi:hypothetical protein
MNDPRTKTDIALAEIAKLDGADPVARDAKREELLAPLRGRRLDRLARGLRNGKRHYTPDAARAGDLVEMSGGRAYRVAPDGSLRRIR